MIAQTANSNSLRVVSLFVSCDVPGIYSLVVSDAETRLSSTRPIAVVPKEFSLTSPTKYRKLEQAKLHDENLSSKITPLYETCMRMNWIDQLQERPCRG